MLSFYPITATAGFQFNSTYAAEHFPHLPDLLTIKYLLYRTFGQVAYWYATFKILGTQTDFPIIKNRQ